MPTLNLGILAHVDAGKTSLTERLLYEAGAIAAIGSVDDGDTQTDSLDQERRRGITIKTAVASFVVGDVTVNLIDTPGHPDFVAEVERVLNVLDGAVLVISAVEGVQAQTRVLMRTLQRLAIPTLIFVNKIDRRGAQDEAVLQAISERLTQAIVAMGSARDLGGQDADFTPFEPEDQGFRARLVERLADHDDLMLAAYLEGGTLTAPGRLRKGLAAQTRRALVHPVYFGSAITGAGVEALMAGVTRLLPRARADADGPVSGAVFKVERGPAGEKIAYVRMFSGTLRTRDRLKFGQGKEAKVTAIGVFDRGGAVKRDSLAAGQIGKLWGLGDIQIGDAVGLPREGSAQRHFAPPTLETVIVPRRAAERGALLGALVQLAEQDPLINLRQDDIRQEIYVSLYGEVQKEVIQETLASAYGVEVEFDETTTICIERPVGSGCAVEVLREWPNPFLATVGLRIDPAPIDSGVTFRLEVEFGSIPHAFHRAVEETVFKTLGQGLHGWAVTDCVVTMTHSGYQPRQSHSHAIFDKSMSSTAGDFRNLTPLVLMAALKQAGVAVCEPMQRFELDIPGDTLGSILSVLAQVEAVPRTQAMRGSACRLEGEIPAARVHELQQKLPTLTRGEGVLETAFHQHQPVRGPVPSRPRTDHDPLDRKVYLLNLKRRV
ncbi:translation factor GTPase family protein [Phenylobacterium sp.]|uniref:translation factor GTPase family protein n=1 Tax=Phenylobacterium sp. TaxID=1871053 RepID=UPI002FCC99C7